LFFRHQAQWPDDVLTAGDCFMHGAWLPLKTIAIVHSFLLCFQASLVATQTDGGDSLSLVQTEVVGKSGLSVELRQSTLASVFVVRGLVNASEVRKLDQDKLKEQFRVSVHQPDSTGEMPALLGTYSVHGTELHFESRFPLSSSVRYRVELGNELTGAGRPERLLFSARETASKVIASVSAIYPSSDVIPENVLKFYIHFSAPMSRGQAYQRIHLFEGTTEVEAPFLELGEELWDSEQTRFTLFVHPGRIKRGVKPREDSGLPMTDGREYSLVVDREWLSADRKPMNSRFVKKFRATASDEEQPDPTRWKIGTPKARSRESVSITFNEPLDHAMLSRVLVVRDPAGKLVEGTVSIVEHETRWHFEPTKAWGEGDYAVEVATNLEDLTGNSLARPFETKPQELQDVVKPPTMIAIEFFVH